MRRAELRPDSTGKRPEESPPEQQISAAPEIPRKQDEASRRGPKRLALLLMVASSLFMIVMIGLLAWYLL
jgi:hypothetical protein